RYLRRLIRDNGISVVRAGDPMLMGLYGWALARTCGIPLVVRMSANYERLRAQTGRPIYSRLPSRRIERALERFVIARAHLVPAGNEENLRYVLSMGVPPSRTTLFRVGNLVDRLHFTDPAQRRG